jgi:hypothetical protein
MRVIAVATPKDKPGASIGPGRQRYFEGAKMSDNHAAVHDSLRRRLAAASCVAFSARPFTRIFRIQSQSATAWAGQLWGVEPRSTGIIAPKASIFLNCWPVHSRALRTSGIGATATSRIKADPALRSIPIIAVTSDALSGEEKKARGREASTPARSFRTGTQSGYACRHKTACS